MRAAGWMDAHTQQTLEQKHAAAATLQTKQAHQLAPGKACKAEPTPEWRLAVARAAAPTAAADTDEQQASSRAADEAAALSQEHTLASGGAHLMRSRGSAVLQSQDIMADLLREVHSMAPEDALLTARSGAGTARPNLARITPLSRFQSESAQGDRERRLEQQLAETQRQLELQRRESQRELELQQRESQGLRERLRRLEGAQQQQRVSGPGRMCGCFGF